MSKERNDAYTKEQIAKWEAMSGIDRLRFAVGLLDHCREDFNDPEFTKRTATDLMKIAQVSFCCAWDFYPDQWTERQVKDALQGIVPQWNDKERPLYPHTGQLGVVFKF